MSNTQSEPAKMNVRYFIKAIIFAALSSLIDTPLQVLNSIFILKDDGPPEASFLIPIGIIGFFMKALFAIAYVLFGNRLPIINEKLRAFAFISFIWISAYIPQVLGMAGADGPVVEVAFNIPILICDSISFFIDGMLLGLLFKGFSYHELSPCSKPAVIMTMLASAIAFPVFTIILELLLGIISPTLHVYHIMQVTSEQSTTFYIIFYACFIITGASLPLFYRLTEYNAGKPKSALRFGVMYSICLWSPIVLIMIAFGMSVLPTLIYTAMFIVCIVTITVMNGMLIQKLNSRAKQLKSL